eukprot:6195835-Prymnesium_polylepis.1
MGLCSSRSRGAAAADPPQSPRAWEDALGVASCHGARGAPDKVKVNQDCGMIVWPLGGVASSLVASVFDGHGAHGE